MQVGITSFNVVKLLWTKLRRQNVQRFFALPGHRFVFGSVPGGVIGNLTLDFFFLSAIPFKALSGGDWSSQHGQIPMAVRV